jgi:hypothetical protein
MCLHQLGIQVSPRTFFGEPPLFFADLEKRIIEGGFIRASWCSWQKCEEKINEETGATMRIVLFEKDPS